MIKKLIGMTILSILFILQLSTFVFAANLQDPYEAYGLAKGDEEIATKIYDNPPKVIALKPVRVRWFDIDMPLQREPILIEYGKEAKFNFAVQGTKDKVTVNIQSNIQFT